jgi:hypothetical protein
MLEEVRRAARVGRIGSGSSVDPAAKVVSDGAVVELSTSSQRTTGRWWPFAHEVAPR